MELQIEGRNVELRKSWQDKISEERDRLTRHHAGLVHNLRVTIEATTSHKSGGFEVRIIAGVPNDTVVVKRKGTSVKPLLVEAFDTLGLQLKELQRKETTNRPRKRRPRGSKYNRRHQVPVSDRILRIHRHP